MAKRNISRRNMLAASAAAGLGLALCPWRTTLAAGPRPFRIGACDWSIGHKGRVSALELAARLGLDGVQASFDKPGAYDDLRLEDVRKRYAEAEKKHGVVVQSLAMGVLNSVPLASSPEAERYVEECIEVMPKMGQKVVLLAFFGKGDIKGRPDLQAQVIERLKRLAPKAEKAGVVLGVESQMNAEEHMHIVDGVGSPSVKVYYDVANMTDQGYDIFEEIRFLAKKGAICEFHCKENGALLGRGKVDFEKFRAVIDEIGYKDWLVMESAVPKDMPVEEAYPLNAKYLRALFSREAKDKG